jgi:tRNA (cytidine56-2'-O)-methyltransferase
MPRIAVLRIGHRMPRDNRVTTHVALTARAFGADEILVDREDRDLEARVEDVVRRFGGPFRIKTGVNWRKTIREWKGPVVHLTMYGEHMDDVLERIPAEDVLIVVGSEKGPGEVFRMATFNVAVGNQPHSEVAALAVFLDRLLKGAGVRKSFMGRVRVIPSPRGKVLEEDAT